MKKVIQKIDTIIADCEKTIEETWSGDTDFVLNAMKQVISDLKVLKKTIKN